MLNPVQVVSRLEAIEADLADRQGELEDAAEQWFRVKRDLERDRARAFLEAVGSVEQRKAIAVLATSQIGRDEEAAYESLKAVVRVLETRATIGMALAKTNGRLS